ncbi:MAG: NlpC/P60 family protein [Candidatus Eisenbacteria bacterium]|nr:NlpC/P60 family protein [Candidatus Eisenbacteria bacterium]
MRKVVATSVADLRKRPSHSSELVSQGLMGTEVEILGRNRTGTWLKVALPDGYAGWMRSWYLSVRKPARRNREVLVGAALTFVRERPLETSHGLTDAVMGSRLTAAGAKGSWVRVLLPDGRKGWIRKKDLLLGPRRGEGSAESVVRTARSLLGVQYLWGGKSVKGFDCSGFVQFVFELNGLSLPRDSRDQFRSGSRISWPRGKDRLLAGDLLFFGKKGKAISHVAIYIGSGRMIHCQGQVRMGSVRGGTGLYDASLMRLFRGARRIIFN